MPGVNNGKYLSRNATTGRREQVDGLGISVGTADANKIVKTGSDGKLDSSLMPLGVTPDLDVMPASEALSAGKYVNIWNDAGVSKLRLADATNGRDAHGFVNAAFAQGAQATIYYEGPNRNLTALNPGSRYYLNTSGGVTDTPRTTGIHQFLGVASSATSINTDIDDGIDL